MKVILIGAGRYGNGILGSKYTNGEYYGVDLGYVVDPNIEKIKQSPDYMLGDAETCDSFEKVPEEQIDETIAEIAIVPALIPETFKKIANKKIKRVILPKPVTSNYRNYKKMVRKSQQMKMQTAVTSNWYFSELTKLTKAVLDKVRGKQVDPETDSQYSQELAPINDGFIVEKAEIEYSKQNERLIIDPPSQEMPHALQMIYSTGLSDFRHVKVEMDKSKQSESAVNVRLSNVEGVRDGITINSDLQKGDKTDQKRERLLKIYLDDDDKDPDIVTDYDVQIDNGVCKKYGTVSVDITRDGKTTKWQREIKEDNMDAMYASIFKYFKGQQDDTLTLEKYRPIAKKICEIQAMWEKCIGRTDKKS